LVITSAAALGGADGTAGTGTTVALGAQLGVQGGLTIGNEALTLGGSGIAAAGALQAIGTVTWGGPITLGANATVTSVVAGSTLTLNGNILADFGLTVTGAGDTVINGAISGQVVQAPG